MKRIFLLLNLVLLFTCSCNKKRKSDSDNGISKNQVSEKRNAAIKSINFKKSEIIGESHYGFGYEFDIQIDNSDNLNIENFCKKNFSFILNSRVTEKNVIKSIIAGLNEGKYDVDKNSARLIIKELATEFFDAVEVEIFLKERDLLKLDLKFYSPL